MTDTRVLGHDVVNAVLNAGRPVGLGDVPGELTERPYVVIDILPSGLPEGSWGDEHDMRDVMFNVQCVGSDWDECSGMAVAARKAWLRYGRLVPGYVGLWIDSEGAIVRVDDQTYNATDTWRMKVQG